LSATKKAAIGASVVLGSLGIGGASAALLGAGSASAATNPPSTGTPSSQGTKAQHFLRRHSVDGTITVKTKNGFETLNFARGTVGAISSSSITVNSPDGTSLTATIDAQTKFHNTTDAQLAQGDKVGVLAYQGVARVVNAPKAGTPSSTGSSSTGTSSAS